MNKWLKKYTFQLKVASFILMLVLPVGLYFAAEAGATGLIWLQLALSASTGLVLIRF